ncbi:hypothetical protein NP233_g596 [Leucocoprinus birnbaumii]|uniref:Uncharacterized protein n=1 Tax=Leucocoprinus birnbaumii TaxID=56174 RepID=A0AAD5W3J6_9AGAR|nr:hypothetical protein NP233_g596 [Leucocoprinus birnbaumii]
MTAQPDEEAMDFQDLQAQIDLSMSFAQNLVSSWVKPTQYTQTNRQVDLENEIKEYMRRPARLGVGAPIPETQSLAREAAKLKSKLEGSKKRHREDAAVEAKKTQSDDEEDSRSGAIKKKVRVDPFHAPSKKEKKGGERNGKAVVHPAAMKAMLPTQTSEAPTKEGKLEADEDANELLVVTDTPEKLKNKSAQRKPHANAANEEAPRTDQADVFNFQTSSVERSTSSKASKLAHAPAGSNANLPLAQPSAASPVSPRTHSDGRIAGVGLIKQPLLNLRGSPSEPESENEGAGASGLTPKKKRKRRKKKKSQPLEEPG